MKSTCVFVLAGFATILAASRLVFVSSAEAAPISLSSPKVEKVPGPDFQPASYFANRKATYQAEKTAHPEKYTTDAKKEPEWFFTGKPYDADSKSYFFKYRNYRPDTASWMTPDPAGFPDGPNNYAYAPVPTMEMDPTGQRVEVWSHTASSGNTTRNGTFQHTFLNIVPDAGGDAFQIGAGPSQSPEHWWGDWGYVEERWNGEGPVNTDVQNYQGLVQENEDDTQYILDLLSAYAHYDLHTDPSYFPFPNWFSSGYNSNSYTSGIIDATGGTAPSFSAWTPGWGSPIPVEYFRE